MADIIKFPTKDDGSAEFKDFMRKSLRGIRSLDVCIKIKTVGFEAETAWAADDAHSRAAADSVRERLKRSGIAELGPDDPGPQFYVEVTASRTGGYCYATGFAGILEVVHLHRPAAAPVPGITWSCSGGGTSDARTVMKLVSEVIGGFVEAFQVDFAAMNPPSIDAGG